MTTAKTLHLHTFRNGYHVALDDTTNIPTYPMQYVVSFRTPDQRGLWQDHTPDKGSSSRM